MHRRTHSHCVFAAVCAIGCAHPSGFTHDAPPSGLVEPRRAPYAVERTSVLVKERRLSVHLPRGLSPPLPSVLVFHSAMGRTQSVLQWCDRLAQHGFAAVALDFYDGKVAASPDEARALRDSANARAPLLKAVVEEAYRQMQTDARLRSNQRFLLGWSFGAAWATVAGGFLPDLKGIVAVYGEAFSEDATLYEKLRAPILFVGAEQEPDLTPARLRAIAGRLEGEGKSAEIALVPAAHGFAERMHPGYDHAAAETAWTTVIRFLEERVR